MSGTHALPPLWASHVQVVLYDCEAPCFVRLCLYSCLLGKRWSTTKLIENRVVGDDVTHVHDHSPMVLSCVARFQVLPPIISVRSCNVGVHRDSCHHSWSPACIELDWRISDESTSETMLEPLDVCRQGFACHLMRLRLAVEHRELSLIANQCPALNGYKRPWHGIRGLRASRLG